MLEETIRFPDPALETLERKSYRRGGETVNIGKYLSRWDLILERCRNKKVLHLGCVGMTEAPLAEKIRAMRADLTLHAHVKRVALQVVGIDYDVAAVTELNRIGFREIVAGDVRNLDSLGLGNDFELVLCGDLIEHLDEPGRMLKSVGCCMSAQSELLITTPNAFGLPNLLRYCAGQAVEGGDHVVSFNIYTLRNLLARHGFRIDECYSCYDRRPSTRSERLFLTLGAAVLKMIPALGGTLAVAARKCD